MYVNGTSYSNTSLPILLITSLPILLLTSLPILLITSLPILLITSLPILLLTSHAHKATFLCYDSTQKQSHMLQI